MTWVLLAIGFCAGVSLSCALFSILLSRSPRHEPRTEVYGPPRPAWQWGYPPPLNLTRPTGWVRNSPEPERLSEPPEPPPAPK